jgi:hypothetical protein
MASAFLAFAAECLRLNADIVAVTLADPIAPLQVKAMQDAARSLRVILYIHDIGSADELPGTFSWSQAARG